MLLGSLLLAQPAFAGGSGTGNTHGNGGGSSNAGGKSNAGGNGKSNSHGHAGVNSEAAELRDLNSALGLREAGMIRPLTDVYTEAERRFGGEVIDALLELRDARVWTYDLRLVTDDGWVRTLSYDATTLALIAIDGKPVQ